MKKLELFEPAMCCSTGVCGPSVDPTLLMITSVFEILENTSTIEAIRHNLTSDPDAFVKNKVILELMKEKGNDVLPITLLDGKIVKSGDYPTKDELTKYTGLTFSDEKISCCDSSEC